MVLDPGGKGENNKRVIRFRWRPYPNPKIVVSSTSWKPEKYKDRYRVKLMAWVEKKAKAGKTKVIEEEKEAPEREVRPEAVDMIALLRKSMEQSGNGRKRKRHEATA